MTLLKSLLPDFVFSICQLRSLNFLLSSVLSGSESRPFQAGSQPSWCLLPSVAFYVTRCTFDEPESQPMQGRSTGRMSGVWPWPSSFRQKSCLSSWIPTSELRGGAGLEDQMRHKSGPWSNLWKWPFPSQSWFQKEWCWWTSQAQETLTARGTRCGERWVCFLWLRPFPLISNTLLKAGKNAHLSASGILGAHWS